MTYREIVKATIALAKTYRAARSFGPEAQKWAWDEFVEHGVMQHAQ